MMWAGYDGCVRFGIYARAPKARVGKPLKTSPSVTSNGTWLAASSTSSGGKARAILRVRRQGLDCDACYGAEGQAQWAGGRANPKPGFCIKKHQRHQSDEQHRHHSETVDEGQHGSPLLHRRVKQRLYMLEGVRAFALAARPAGTRPRSNRSGCTRRNASASGA